MGVNTLDLSDEILGKLDALAEGLNYHKQCLAYVKEVKHERQQVFLPLLNAAISHARAIHLLISNGCYPSALVLLRPLVEAFARSVWLLYAATDTEYEAFRGKEHLGLKFKELVKAADEKWPESQLLNADAGLLTAMVERRWSPLNSLVHGGMLQVYANSQFDQGKFIVGAAVSDDVLTETIFIAAFHVLYGTGELLKASDLDNVVQEQKIRELFCLLKPLLDPSAPASLA